MTKGGCQAARDLDADSWCESSAALEEGWRAEARRYEEKEEDLEEKRRRKQKEKQ
jgi:hypothetical protein